MDTGTSSHPSYTSNAYGVISVHPTPWPPDLPSGRVYRRIPSASAGARPDAAGGHAHHRGSGGRRGGESDAGGQSSGAETAAGERGGGGGVLQVRERVERDVRTGAPGFRPA